MKLNPWLKILMPLIIGILGFLGLRIFKTLSFYFYTLNNPLAIHDEVLRFNYGYLCTAISNPPSYQNLVCSVFILLLSFLGLYLLCLSVVGFVLIIWELLARKFRFKKASELKTWLYFITPLIVILLLFLAVYFIDTVLKYKTI